jgi:hypothetical protein
MSVHIRPERITIPLRGRDGELRAEALIDACDAALDGLTWYLASHGYAVSHAPRSSPGPRLIYLHRAVMGDACADLEVDHINRNRLDCRRVNLRIVTHAQNMQNWPALAGKTSAHRGVFWDKGRRKWAAKVHLGGKGHNLGRFGSEEEAASAALAFRAEHMPFSVEAVA